MNTKETEIFLKRFRKYKIAHAAVLVFFEAAYLLTVLLHPSLRNSMYSNSTLLSLSILVWVLLLISFIFVLHDVVKMEKAVKKNHELNRLAHLDELTDMPNRYSCDKLLREYEKGSELTSLGVSMMEIANLQEINDTKGRETGDILVHDFAEILVKCSKKYGFVCRNSGNEFLAVFCDCDNEKMDSFFALIDEEIKSYNADASHEKLVYNHEKYMNCDEHVETFSELARGVHKKLHGNEH
ncbi:MAG: diguanylate cyclase [Lachnospiraceae bacterium]|nr:diguanylate cyclase [Candidatus Merdinaster equi]